MPAADRPVRVPALAWWLVAASIVAAAFARAGDWGWL